MSTNFDNIKKIILEKINSRTKPATIRIDKIDSIWNEMEGKIFEEHRLSNGDCKKCAMEIAKTVHLELLKQGYRK